METLKNLLVLLKEYNHTNNVFEVKALIKKIKQHPQYLQKYNIDSIVTLEDSWLMVGADYNQLEDMVSALTTKDPNKLSVYIEGYDSHSLRTYYYNNKDLEGIIDTVESINTIKDKYPLLRYESKTCTFA